MSRQDIIQIISEKMKLIRTETNYTQEQMADYIGISKKTLIQIEKQRVDCGWTVAVTISVLFRNSSILKTALGGDPLIFIELISNNGKVNNVPDDVTNQIWWRTIESSRNWVIQQNLVHTSFRILNPEQKTMYYALSKEDTIEQFKNYIK